MLRLCGRLSIPLPEFWQMDLGEWDLVVAGRLEAAKDARRNAAMIAVMVHNANAREPTSIAAFLGEDDGEDLFADPADLHAKMRRDVEEKNRRRFAAWLPPGIDLGG